MAGSSKLLLTDGGEGPLREVGWRLQAGNSMTGRARVVHPEPASASLLSPQLAVRTEFLTSHRLCMGICLGGVHASMKMKVGNGSCTL